MTEDDKGEASVPTPNNEADAPKAEAPATHEPALAPGPEASGVAPVAPAAHAAPMAPIARILREDWRKWAFAIVPIWGIFELIAHAKQTRSVVPESDWKDAKAAVVAIAQPNDLVLFAPTWSDPLGREWFGDDVASIAREARPDESRFARAIEVSIRGKHRAEIAGWTRGDSKRVGAITITTYENPAPVKVIDDLLDHDGPSGMRVQRIDAGREGECGWIQSTPQTGGLGFGPTVPGHRFACGGGNFVGISIIHDMDNAPRRCFFAPPGGGSSVLRVRFTNVAFGQALHGHVGMAQFAERDLVGTPVTLAWKVGEKSLGRIVHNDGDGWKGFELATADLAGQHGDLIAEITSASGSHRHYCFEADTR